MRRGVKKENSLHKEKSNIYLSTKSGLTIILKIGNIYQPSVLTAEH